MMTKIQSKRTTILITLLLATLTYCQIAPQFSLTNPVLGTVTSYRLSYYSNSNLTNATVFGVSFNQSNLQIPDGINNCTIRVSGNTVSSPSCNCVNRICTFRPMVASNPGSVQILIQNITNPMYLFPQTLYVSIYFNTSLSFNHTTIIPSSNYQPMSMIINSITQSDYGVGYTPVTYNFNISLYYISQNMQMQVTIPPQITFSSISSSLSFYSTIQNLTPMQVQSLLIFPLQVAANSNPNGFMLLSISGLGNPRFLGNSSSFKVTFVQTLAVPQCSTCKIAEISSGLIIQSRVPGDVLAVSLNSNNQYVSAVNILSINLQLYAGIPQGGRVSITLPPQITPTLPIQCNNIYGFTFTDSNPPTCTYNSTSNKIDTVNFNTPYFDSTGNGIISIQIINPLDSRPVNFTFQTFDNFSRMIGQSRSNSYFSAIPIVMNATLNKTAQQVDTIFNMSGQITLTQALNYTTNYIEVILPPVAYNLANIQCFSAGLNLNCNTSYDGLQQLYIRFAPPCVQCTAGSTLRFSITNLKNPAYINDANQLIILNTRSTQGIIQTSPITLQLTPSIITLSSYTKPINQIIGTQYDLQMNLNLPDYVKINGGQIQIIFSPNSVYYDGQLSGFNYNGPSYTLQIVTNTSSTILTNSVQYYTNNTPDTIYKIIFNICDGIISICNLSTLNYSFTIKRLKLGYIPSIQSSDTLIITTKYGQIISQKIIDTSQFSPILYTNTLNITSTKSITNSYSDFQFIFTLSQIVIDNILIFTLPNNMNINGQCSLNSNNQGFISGYICNKINSTAINISSIFDQNIMISQNITFIIGISNVSTPISTAPLNYIVSTTFNNTKNTVFSTRYAMQSVYPLNVTYSKTNYTINQLFNLTFNITPVTLLYDSYQIILLKNTIIIQQNWLTNLILTQNTTHYILTGTGFITNNSTTISGQNSLSTISIPQYTINLLQANYLVQQNIITDITNIPVVLGCNISITNRTVSMLANMTIICDRNSNNGELGDTGLVIQLPSNSFDYSNAVVNGVVVNSISPVVNIPISVTSPRIISTTITSIRNLLYIPNLSPTSQQQPSNSISSIQITTISNEITKILGKTIINPSIYIPNDAYDIKNTISIRNNIKCGNFTNITINYNTILGTNQHLMHIILPTGQNIFSIGNTGCYIGVNSNNGCNIVQINSTDMKIVLVPNQTITLTKVTNLYPNTNNLAIKIYTYPQMQLVQQSYNIITPAIALQPIQITSRSLTSKIGQINTIALFLTPTQLKIQASNTIIITIPTGFFTRTFNNDDCIIRPSSSTSNFTGCTYNFDSNGWLTNITIGSIGPFDVQINSTLGISFGVTNGWGSYPFAGKSIIVTVYNSINSGTSQGAVNLIDMFSNLQTFSLISISQSLSTLTQSSLLSSSSNIISINFALNGNIGKSTTVLCLLPKDSFIYTQTNSTVWQLQRQDPSYYYISIPTNCTTNGCQLYSQSMTLNIFNSYFIKKQRNNIILYAVYDNLVVSQSYSVNADIHVALTIPNLVLSRSSNIGADLTNVTVTFSMLPVGGLSVIGLLNFGQVQVDISNNITSPVYSTPIYSYTQQDPTTQTVQSITTSIIKNNQNITTLIPSTVSNSSNIHKIQIQGKNSFEVPINGEKYWIIIQNGTHVFYASYGISFSQSLVPMSVGLTLVRTNTIAGVITQLKLQGGLPSDQIINMGLYPVTVNGQNFGTITQSSSISLPLFSYTNPLTIFNESSLPISICSQTACIYRQTSCSITPPLTAIQYTSNDINWTIPSTMNINSQNIMTINFTAPIVNKSYINIAVDDRLVSALTGVNLYQLNNQANTNINYTINPNNNRTNPQKILTIRSSTPNTNLTILSISLTFTSPAYQTILSQSTQSLFFELPSTTYSQVSNFTILSPVIAANLTSSSNQTNQIANYSLLIWSISRAGLLTVQLPNFISQLFNGGTPNNYADDTMSSHLSVKLNGVAIGITGTRTQNVGTGSVTGLYLLDYDSNSGQYVLNIALNQTSPSTPRILDINLLSIPNPINNRPFYFTIIQHEMQTTPTLIYGYTQLSYKMTILNPITVYSGIRNVTKIGSRVSVTFDIQTQSNSNSNPDVMVIKMSTTQVTVSNTDINGTSYPCQVCIDGINCGTNGITISVMNGTNSIQLSPHRPGRHNYTIYGCLINSLFSQQPTLGDQIYISLSQPYQTAQSTQQSSTYITPLISTGQIQIISQQSSSNKRADYTTLSLIIKPENYQNCDGILLNFDPLTYYIHQNIQCFINSINAQYHAINSSAVFIKVQNLISSTISIQVKNIINYIQNNGFSISTLKQKIPIPTNSSTQNRLSTSTIQYNPNKYGIADQIIITSVSNNFIAYNAQTRIIFPDNYISTQPKKIIAINDFNLPRQLPVSTLRYLFNSNIPGCSQDLLFNKSISMSCILSNSGNTQFTIKLYDTKLSAVSLTSYTKSIYIYPGPKQRCTNTLCDVCSIDQAGGQYCFVCREGLFSNNGQCINDCPAQTFAYNSQTCTECSPSCKQCYDLYDNSCLSCRDTGLVLDSGVCRDHCTTGYSYQAQFCVNGEQCSISAGCRLCSSTGFCYQCLPDFKGQPNCQYSQILPKNFFIFWMIPFILLLPIVSIITCIKVGRVTFSHMLIFILSIIQFISWVLIIPKMPEQALAMVMCAFLLLKIIISIISYETYYKKQIHLGKQQRLLQNNQHQSQQKTDNNAHNNNNNNVQTNSKKSKQNVKNTQIQQNNEQKITHKQRLCRFLAHFISCDAYQLLMNKLGKPYMNIAHFIPYFVLSMLNRFIVVIFLIYVMVKNSTAGDLLYLPLIAIITGLGIGLIRLITSEKAAACLSRIRG